MKLPKILTPLALGFCLTHAASAQISTLNKQLFTGNSGATHSYDATGADKLVVMIGTESGFNNNQVTSVTMNFNSVQMDLAVENTAWNGTSDGGYSGIFYLDNPFQGTATISWSATTTGGGPNGSGITVMGLADTADGVGDTGSALGDSTSLTTTAIDSLVLAAHQNSGNNNGAGTPTADLPLTQIHNGVVGSQWSSYATGEQAVASSGTLVTPTFTSAANGGNHHTVAAEFLLDTSPPDMDPPTLDPGDIVDDKTGGPIIDTETVTYTVTFSEAMKASTVLDTDKFEDGGSSAATINNVTATGDPAVFEVSASPTSTGTLILQVKQDAVMTDLADNPLDTTSAIADSPAIVVNADSTAPTLTSTDFVDDKSGGPILDNETVTYTVTFSKAMNATTVEDITKFENNPSLTDPAPITINSVTVTGDPAVFEVSVDPDGAGPLQLQVKALATIEDQDGLDLDTTTAIADNDTITVNKETTPPTLSPSDIVDNVGGGPIFETQTVIYTVTFSEAMNATTVEDIAKFENGGSPAATINSVTDTGDSTSFTVSVTPGAGAGTLILQVKKDAVMTDLADNALDTTAAIADDTPITVNAGSEPPRNEVMIVNEVEGWLGSDKSQVTTTSGGTTQVNYDATGVDKLVVAIGTESGFNNNAITSIGVTFNGTPLTTAVEEFTAPPGSPPFTNDGGGASILYLDAPFQGVGTFSVSISTTGGGPNGGHVSIIGLADSADGVGNTGASWTSQGSSGDVSTSLATSATNSLVIAMVENSGANSGAGTPTAVSPLTLSNNGSWGSNWAGAASGYQAVPTSTAVTPTFTTNAGGSIHVVGAEFQGALVVSGDDFATWIGGFGLDPADQDFTDDPDGDGLGNGIEGFFGTNPSIGNAGLTQTAKAGNVFTFQHPEADPALTDVTGSYQWSLDLENWNDSGDTASGTTVTIPDPPAPVGGITTVTATVTDTVPAKLFVRAVATQN